ncbi:adenylate synthase [Herbiconiux moechotypicola]|uniref:Adenylate synthase n=1 Tax=Herbiconiux moechotypicola TaxID=637393 RepID=A0ABP5QMI4_9MICO
MGDRVRSLLLLARFARARWGLRFRSRARLEAWQSRRVRQLFRRAGRTSFYRRLPSRLEWFPVIDKSVLLAEFDGLNTRGLRLVDALAVALEAERSRDFTPVVDGDVVVGLSSGTSGTRGVFLVDPRERALWAGTVLGRLLGRPALRLALDRRRGPLRIAFFLRAGGGLYEAVGSNRVDFSWFDLTRPIEDHVTALRDAVAAGRPPHLLVAPASVLDALARDAVADEFRPLQVISVAEVLEPDMETRIVAAWGRPVRQVYQATEGLLALSCERGSLHLNEESVLVEREWLDDEHTRFRPVVTDFERRTQLVIRYRLDDVLRIEPAAEGERCACGRVTAVIAAIDGRDDAVLHLPAANGRSVVELFPDAVRQAIAAAPTPPGAYRDWALRQHGLELRLSLQNPAPDAERVVAEALAGLLDRYGCAGDVVPTAWVERDPAAKLRRIVREAAA